MTTTVADPLDAAVIAALGEIAVGATVEITAGGDETRAPGVASASGNRPDGTPVTVTVRLGERAARLVGSGEGASLAELVGVLPRAGVAALGALQLVGAPNVVALRRLVRDVVAAEVLTSYLESWLGCRPRPGLVAETIEYLIELSGTRVEAHELTHGVVITDVLHDVPRLRLDYPSGLRTVKRAPLLFDGRRAVLVVDPDGHARTELQRHRFDHLRHVAGASDVGDGWTEAGSLVAAATRALGGVGLYVRADRSIWTFVEGQPLLVRRGEHWTAFPVELTASLGAMIGGGRAAELIARAAFIVSTQPHGAILAIADDASVLDGAVARKDRFDLRSEIDESEMRPETWLHHLIDVHDLDEQTLARLATLDGATVVDPDGRLLAYGAIVESRESEHEGARTAAARTLSETASVVLKVSVDGDITIFRGGRAVTTLLGRGA